MSGELVHAQTGEVIAAPRFELSVDEVVAQADKIREIQKRVMKPGLHFGVPFGQDGDKPRKGKDGKDLPPPKPSLLKAGAELLCLVFRLAAEYEIVKSVETTDEISFLVRCTLVHTPTGIRYGSGLGSCTSRESKYLRDAQRKCPRCKEEQIRHSKDGGWYCWRKLGGCGAEYADGDPSIEDQIVGKVTDPRLYDQHNAILKMAQKRAFVGVTLNCTAASESFGQDLEDHSEAPVSDGKPKTDTKSPTGATGSGVQIRATLKQLNRYRELVKELGATEEAGRVRVAAFLGHDFGSVSDLTAEEMARVIAKMEHETAKGGAA